MSVWSVQVCVCACACVCACVCVCVCVCVQMQLVHVPLSGWHNAVLGTQLGKACYYSITHSLAPSSQASHVSPGLDRLPALPLQVWLTGLDQDGLPTSRSPSEPPQSTLLLLGDV